MVAVPQHQGETPTLRFNATATTARGIEKRVQKRGMKFDARKREQATRASRPSERNRSMERCGCSKTSKRLEIQYRLDIHHDRRWCRVRKISEEGEQDDDNDGVITERIRNVRARISASGLAVNANVRFSYRVNVDNKFLIADSVRNQTVTFIHINIFKRINIF